MNDPLQRAHMAMAEAKISPIADPERLRHVLEVARAALAADTSRQVLLGSWPWLPEAVLESEPQWSSPHWQSG